MLLLLFVGDAYFVLKTEGDLMLLLSFFERRSSIPMQLFYRGFHIDWVFWVNTTWLVIDGFSLSTSFGFFVQIDY